MSPTTPTVSVDAVRAAVHDSFPAVVSDLTDLVAIPSVSADGHDQAQVARSAQHVAGLLRQAGLEAEVLSVTGPGGVPGRPAVLAHRQGPQGARRVLR